MTVNADDQAIIDELNAIAQELPARLAGANQAAIDAAVQAATEPLNAQIAQLQQDHADGTAGIKQAADAVKAAVEGAAPAAS